MQVLRRWPTYIKLQNTLDRKWYAINPTVVIRPDQKIDVTSFESTQNYTKRGPAIVSQGLKTSENFRFSSVFSEVRSRNSEAQKTPELGSFGSRKSEFRSALIRSGVRACIVIEEVEIRWYWKFFSDCISQFPELINVDRSCVQGVAAITLRQPRL